MALEVTDATFETVVMKEEKLVVLDFWAQWCGPCKQIAPVIDELATEYEGKAVIGKVDVDSASELTAKYSVRNIPTVLFIKGGEVVEKLVGANTKAKFAETIEKHL